MATTTSFDEFWEINGASDAFELQEIRNVVEGLQSASFDRVDVQNGFIITRKRGGSVKLLIASEEARIAFLIYIDKHNRYPDFDVDSAAEWQHTRQKLEKE